jgi:hypothetical protein
LPREGVVFSGNMGFSWGSFCRSLCSLSRSRFLAYGEVWRRVGQQISSFPRFVVGSLALGLGPWVLGRGSWLGVAANCGSCTFARGAGVRLGDFLPISGVAYLGRRVKSTRISRRFWGISIFSLRRSKRVLGFSWVLGNRECDFLGEYGVFRGRFFPFSMPWSSRFELHVDEKVSLQGKAGELGVLDRISVLWYVRMITYSELSRRLA